ncbi:MAG: VWA domain-containing protein [Myxococcota bacterium]|nr:VWA domain-containing protein [Myxococcota bacterium]
MNFEYPLVLLGVPLVAIGGLLAFSRRGRVNPATALQRATSLWAGPSGVSDRPRRVTSTRGIALVLGSALVLVSLARPQWGAEEEVVFDQSREVVIALDLSRSMGAADVTPTRLDRAKMLIDALLDELRGERVGLIVFAGTSFLQVPLSADYEVMRDLVPELSPDYLPQGGTDYAAMLRTALRSFHDADGRGDRFLIVLSDGEAHEEDWRSFLPDLRAAGIRVLGLGVATTEGAVIPDGRGGLVKDPEGAVVLSRLAPVTLQELARETDGTYRDAAAWVDLHQLVEVTVERGVEGDYREGSDRRMQDRFQWFLLPGFALLGLAFWLDFPVPVARRRIQGSRPLQAGMHVGLALCMTGMIASSRGAEAVESPAPMTPELAQVVAELVEKPEMQATDYAHLAEATVAYVEAEGALEASARLGVIDDAQSGIDHGEALDASAADWPDLRRRLAALRTPPPSADESPSQSDPGSEGDSPDDTTSESQPQEANDSSSSPAQGESEGKANPDSEASNSASNESESGESGGSAGSQSENGESESDESASESASESGGESSGFQAPDEPSRSESDPEIDENRREMDREAAGFGELDSGDGDDAQSPEMGSGKEADEPSDDPEPGEGPPRRIVGGGSGQDESVAPSSPMFGALGRMEEIRKNDSPGRLFSRMNAMEDPRQATRGSRGKDW